MISCNKKPFEIPCTENFTMFVTEFHNNLLKIYHNNLLLVILFSILFEESLCQKRFLAVTISFKLS